MSFVRICGSDDEKAWLAARLTGIGASEAPSLFGVGWESALSLYSRKLGLGQEHKESPELRWGKRLEALILDEFAHETKRRIEHGGQLLRSREWPWMLVTLDAEQVCDESNAPREFKVTGPGNVEAKNTRWLAGDWEDGVPRRVYIQMQQGMAVTGRSWASACVLLYGSRFLWADVPRDEKFIREALIPAGTEFWERVVKREPPAPDGTDSARHAIRRLFPDMVPGKLVSLPGDLVELDDEREMLAERMKVDDLRKSEIENRIRLAIGDAEIGALANGIKYALRSQTRGAYTVEASTFRTLRRLTPKKKR